MSDPSDSPKSKGGALLRAKKNVAGKMASSGLVKKAIPNEANELLNCFTKLCEKLGQGKRGETVVNNILKLVIKAKVLSDEKLISTKDFLQADVPLRQAFEILERLYTLNGNDVRINQNLDKFNDASAQFRIVESMVSERFQPHVQPKTMNRIKQIFELLADTDFLVNAFKSNDVAEELAELVIATTKYTQFHY
eukprot:TRINITY_DN3649_c0_g2_i1.p1 TRINITY_DN3649_c0_g2~~TRINITY_DN3649_c0_g2_i1.p1  ORF type:complete len:207 (+),score=98.98 TRINITY_DN3649_c0_g2_i1:42-623(+)